MIVISKRSQQINYASSINHGIQGAYAWLKKSEFGLINRGTCTNSG